MGLLQLRTTVYLTQYKTEGKVDTNLSDNPTNLLVEHPARYQIRKQFQLTIGCLAMFLLEVRQYDCLQEIAFEDVEIID